MFFLDGMSRSNNSILLSAASIMTIVPLGQIAFKFVSNLSSISRPTQVSALEASAKDPQPPELADPIKRRVYALAAGNI